MDIKSNVVSIEMNLCMWMIVVTLHGSNSTKYFEVNVYRASNLLVDVYKSSCLVLQLQSALYLEQ